MNRLEEIFELLDWNNSEVEQAAGVALAKQLDDFSPLFQPLTERYNKNVWDNCAIVLAAKTDEQLSPFAEQLFEWTADLNWPGAVTILERIKRISSGDTFLSAAIAAVRQAKAEDDTSWKWWLSELLECVFFSKNLPEETIVQLETVSACCPTKKRKFLYKLTQ
ncbi:MAG: hypothetical protein CVV04_12195 [Firmicutes bacterium HGW-Firmicutes-9]|jgi:hypothetical protein|nr:MAG: hypothetical protein CVV04_12195 [Firmicutes bacterium HGW-Firmicutes-9]